MRSQASGFGNSHVLTNKRPAERRFISHSRMAPIPSTRKLQIMDVFAKTPQRPDGVRAEARSQNFPNRELSSSRSDFVRSYGCMDRTQSGRVLEGRNGRLPILGNRERGSCFTYAQYLANYADSHLRRATPERDTRVEVEDISTAASTPEKLQQREGVLTHLLYNTRRVRRYVGVSRAEANAFLSTQYEERKAASEPLATPRAAMAAEMLSKSQNVEFAYDSLNERSDARRVRAGDVGLMKMVVMLGKGQLSAMDQSGYWNRMAGQSKHNILNYLNHLMEVARHNMTEHQRMALSISLDRYKKAFDRSVRHEVCCVIKGLRGKRHEIRPKEQHMVAQSAHKAQGLFSPVVKVVHEIPSLEKFGGSSLKNAPRFIVKTTAMLVSFQQTTTFSQRVCVLFSYLVSFDAIYDSLALLADNSSQVFQNCLAGGAMVAQDKEKFADEVLGQLESNKESLVEALCKVIASAFKLETPQDSFKHFARTRRITSIAAICTSIVGISSFIHMCVSYVHEYAQAQAHGMDVPTYRLYKLAPEMPRFICEIHALYNNDGVVRARREEAVATRIKELFKTGSDYFDALSKSKSTPEQLSSLRVAWGLLMEMHKSAMDFFHSHQERPEPLVIYLVGEPGVGKSRLMHLLMPALCDSLGVDFDPLTDVYSRNPGDKFWDGYKHQRFVLYDDFMQSCSKEARMAEAMDLLRAKNNVSWSLNMARLETKGCTMFTSPFVLISSNTDIPTDIGVQDVRAIKRRRDLVIRVSVHERVRDDMGMPDPSKVREIYKQEISPWIYEFERIHPMTGESLGAIIHFDDLVMECRQKAADLWGEEITRMFTNLIWHPASHASSVGTSELLEDSDSDPDDAEIGDLSDLFFQQYSLPRPAVDVQKADRKKMGLSEKGWQKWSEFKASAQKAASAWLPAKFSPSQSPNPKILWAVAGLGALTVTIGAWKLLNSQAKPNAEATVSGDETTLRVRRKVELRKSVDLQVAQASSDQRGQELLRSRFPNMVCVVRILKENMAESLAHGLLIGGKLIAVPYHIFLYNTRAATVLVEKYDGVYEVAFGDVQVSLRWKHLDMAIMIMPNSFPSYPKQTQHFVDDRDVTTLYLEHVFLITTMQRDDETLMPYIMRLDQARKRGTHEYRVDGDRPEMVKIVDSIHYRGCTRFGDCGAPLIWLHPSVNRKILGFHVAGGTNTGASNILTNTIMEEVFRVYGSRTPPEPPSIDEQPDLEDGVACLAQMYYVGKSLPQQSFRQPSRSEIIPSLIHDVFEPQTAPAALRISGSASPLEIGVRKGVAPLAQLPSADLDIVTKQIHAHYASRPRNGVARVLTLDEGLNGVEGDRWIRPLNMKTSPGAPYIFEPRQGKGKLGYVARVGTKWCCSTRLKQDVDRRLQAARHSQIVETLFVDVLKDERRPLEKVRALNTRIFNTCPVDLNICIRMFFGSFASHIMNNHIECEAAVGINYHSLDWGVLYRRLRVHGNWIAGDYSKYDKTFPRQLMLMVADLANDYYKDSAENQTVRRTLMETLASRYHLANRTIYFQGHGNPSGNPLTVIINSLGNMALMRLAYLALARIHDPRLIYDFEQHVSLSVYGDDNVGTVSNAALWFNMRNISTTLAAYGVTYTPPKCGSQSLDEFIPFEEVTYLKRRFRDDSGIVFAPLPIDVIREIPLWIRRGGDYEDATLVNVFMAQLEAFHWGQAIYEELSSSLYDACFHAGITPSQIPFEEFLTRWKRATLGSEFQIWHQCDQPQNQLNSVGAAGCRGAMSSSWSGDGQFCEMTAQSERKTIMLAEAKNKSQQNTKKPQQKMKPSTKPPTQRQKQSVAVVKPIVKVAVNPLPATASLNVNARPVHKEAGHELLKRLDGSVSVCVVPLIPGFTGATKLDRLVRDYGWTEWLASPTVSYRSLNRGSTATWYIGLFHDLAPEDVLNRNSAIWDYTSSRFVQNPASSNFKIVGSLAAMTQKRFASLGTKRGSWIIMVRERGGDDNGELYLTWSVKCGGMGVEAPPPITFVVEKGVFKDPTDHKTELKGVPFMGPLTTYHFGGANPATAAQIQDFIARAGGLPTEVVRPPVQALPDYTLTTTSPIQSVTMNYGDAVVGNVAKALGTAVEVGAASLGRSAANKLGYGLAKVGSWITKKVVNARAVAQSDDAAGSSSTTGGEESTEESEGFDSFTGTVTVSRVGFGASPYVSVESTPPLFEVEDGDAATSTDNTSKVRALSDSSTTAGTGSNTPASSLSDAMSQVTEEILRGEGKSFSSQVARSKWYINLLKTHGRTLGVASLGLGLGAIAGGLIAYLVKKLKRSPVIIHRGLDALIFTETKLCKGIASDIPSGRPPWDGDGEYDPDAVNPLPDVPDFGAGGDAPGEEVPWAAARKYFSGFVTDDNGKPVVKWLGGWDREDMAQFFSPPQPQYYHNVRRPWDKEQKRTLACKIEVDEALQDHFLLLQAYNWGDDSCGSWLPVEGGAYTGTVARFGGITESRSVIYVDNWAKWNDSNGVHFVVGQSKEKYFSGDEGRACIFACFMGAVKSKEVAMNFLSSWCAHSSVERLTNFPYKKKGGAQASFKFPTHTDFSYSVIQAIPELDPAAPAFDINYQAYKAQTGKPLWNVDRLPIKIEAGPMRILMLARWDNANGWWQHIPIWAHTKTSLSAEWQLSLGLDDAAGADGHEKSSASTSYNHVFCTVKPPRNLATNTTWLAYEVISMNGENAPCAGRCHDGSFNGTWVSTAGPMGVMRGALPGNSGPFRLRFYGDTSRPTSAVDGFGGDVYIMGIATLYLLRHDAGKEAIERWVFHDCPPSLRKPPFVTADYSQEKGWLSTTMPKAFINNTRIDQIKPLVWRFGTRTQFASGTTTTNAFGREFAPLSSGCSLYVKGGYGVEATKSRAVALEDGEDVVSVVDRERPRALADRSSDDPLHPDYPTEPPKVDPPEESEDPEQPDPPPSLEDPSENFAKQLQIISEVEIDSSPAVPGNTKEFTDSWCLTSWSMTLNQRRKLSSTQLPDLERNIAVSINYFDLRGIIPIQSDIVGRNYSGEGATNPPGAASFLPNRGQLPFGVPKAPNGNAPLTIAMIKDVGPITWDYSKDIPELVMETEWSGINLFDTDSKDWSGENSKELDLWGFSYGHTHQFRRLKTQLFISKRIDQRASSALHDATKMYGIQNRNNKFLAVMQVDMADPNARYSDLLSAYIGFDILKDTAYITSGRTTPERGQILTSFLPYEEVRERALSLLPEMVEFVGKWKCWCPCFDTYTDTIHYPNTPPDVERIGDSTSPIAEMEME